MTCLPGQRAALAGRRRAAFCAWLLRTSVSVTAAAVPGRETPPMILR